MQRPKGQWANMSNVVAKFTSPRSLSVTCQGCVNQDCFLRAISYGVICFSNLSLLVSLPDRYGFVAFRISIC